MATAKNIISVIKQNLKKKKTKSIFHRVLKLSSELGSKHKELLCSDVDDTFMRPPLWEDITSSIQNIDPENAIMLGTIATQVKLEASDENLLEPLSSPLLSPLEIKTEKCHLSSAHSALHHNSNALHQNNNNSSSSNNNNNSYHLSGGTYQHQHQNSLNGYLGHGTNGSGGMTLHHSQHQMQNNGGNSSYYNNSWQNHSQVRHELKILFTIAWAGAPVTSSPVNVYTCTGYESSVYNYCFNWWVAPKRCT